MEHPKAIGDRSTLAIMVALQAAEIPSSFLSARTPAATW
jgi:hypothetical protein